MITVAIIDDEKNSREVLKRLIWETGLEIQIVGEADSVEIGFTMINETKPELIFLDVEMLDGTGFDLLEKFETVNFEVIFTTAYDKYAIKAFKFSAIDYLLKPIALDEIEAAIKRVKKQPVLNGNNLLVKALIENFKQESKRIIINSGAKLEIVEVDKIICINSDGAYAEIIIDNGRKIIASKSLKHFDDLLDDNLSFFRISISSLINIAYLQEYSKKKEEIMLKNGMIFKVARRRKSYFLEVLENF